MWLRFTSLLAAIIINTSGSEEYKIIHSVIDRSYSVYKAPWQAIKVYKNIIHLTNKLTWLLLMSTSSYNFLLVVRCQRCRYKLACSTGLLQTENTQLSVLSGVSVVSKEIYTCHRWTSYKLQYFSFIFQTSELNMLQFGPTPRSAHSQMTCCFTTGNVFHHMHW